MQSNDEDIDLFLEEFGKLLNKYHYSISSFQLWKIMDDGVLTAGFTADGREITPSYHIPPELATKYGIKDK